MVYFARRSRKIATNQEFVHHKHSRIVSFLQFPDASVIGIIERERC